ncbi:hypothetical protein N0V93_005093 [Gnomoniopsis smithogilvyi]|uniref:Aminoglycoside phosphotransferase domain-containing protein n=1 Tax=Gnomoniopsis smithogilvyi TaxID=1191159 RepID=A0A9W9CXT4_9PEZI|nr:hypothetical protein N0V93_005093 [Gnomoniopsis smithogilvyi]
MDYIDGEVPQVLSIIETAGLPHPSGELLSSFVTEALNPSSTARFVLETCRAGGSHDKRALLSSLVDDWTYIVESISQRGRPPPAPGPDVRQQIISRDGGRCCITGKPGRIWDPLVVQPILPIPSGWIEQNSPRIFDMLTAFFGPGYRDWWLSYAREAFEYTHFSFNSHWLVRKSAASAFSRGLVKLDRCQPSMIEYTICHIPIGPEQPIRINGEHPLLGDHSREGITTVDPRFLGTHARLARSIQFVELARKFAREKASSPSQPVGPETAHRPKIDSPGISPLSTSFTQLLVTTLLSVWLLVPERVRLLAYRILRLAARRLYEPDTHAVQKLPFGLYLKSAGILDSLRNEHNAMNCVRRYTSIPVPKPLDFVTKPGHGESPDEGYLLMSQIPGVPLWRCCDVLSDKDVAQITGQMQEYIAQMRAIPRTISPENAICNTLGNALRDHHIGVAGADVPVGPFVDEAAFNQVLRYPEDPGRKGHRVFFTHADLNPRNIMVNEVVQENGASGWRVSGIVDWETAGYYPEYWEYTKALYEEFRWSKRYVNMIHGVFKTFGDYSKEYDVEKRDREAGL